MILHGVRLVANDDASISKLIFELFKVSLMTATINALATSRSEPEFDTALARWAVFAALIASVSYQMALCLVHTHVFKVGAALVALSELCIYAVCFILLIRRIHLDFVALVTLTLSYMLLLALLRTQLDFKGFRDLVIPFLFFWVGRGLRDIERADKILKITIYVVLFFGFFEMFFLKYYSMLFNTYSYYVSQGGITAGTNWAEGSVGALNSIRPEGIGRTILPSLLGPNRVSSIFLEPVSLGNFAVISAGWGLAKEYSDRKNAIFFLIAAAIMITMADSRYGLFTVALLVGARVCLRGSSNMIMIVFPFLAFGVLLGIGAFADGVHGDNVVGRFYYSGLTLLQFGPNEILGLNGFKTNFGDIGYANILTKFGLVLCTALWIAFWMVKMRDERGNRFRAYMAIYMSLIMMVSGTSLFALKTAGILWFLLGCCALGSNIVERKAPRKDETFTVLKPNYAN